MDMLPSYYLVPDWKIKELKILLLLSANFGASIQTVISRNGLISFSVEAYELLLL